MTASVGCGHEVDEDDLAPDHNGEMACPDCLADWAVLDDAREWRWWAYSA
ncbi:hypothetical protein P3T35_003069 [Kitasatospora sp. GP30]|nr:hypothetical protein [Kitasatospora sp. GP30]MDH6141056.1 hypothetical protein [Kitasatospora sp. GP30]